jgi:hypothetical protein
MENIVEICMAPYDFEAQLEGNKRLLGRLSFEWKSFRTGYPKQETLHYRPSLF